MLTSIPQRATSWTLFTFLARFNTPDVPRLGLGREKGYTSRLKFILITIKEAKSNVAQFVYTMHRVGKVVPPKRHILKISR